MPSGTLPAASRITIHRVPPDQPWIWLTAGWRDLMAAPRVGFFYGAALVIGAGLGAYGLGTLNLWLSGVPGVGRSILGALCGAVVAIEGYKAASGVKGSTGLIFVPAFCVAVMVGRMQVAIRRSHARAMSVELV